ncbi:MAG: AEC family transporter [Alphaproteobacteria bacterium]|nr:AEC family transporter [Alphaproteobacteria bacterium]
MVIIINALLPVFLIIALGWGIRRMGFADSALWAPLERLIYFILFPCLLVQTLATADLAGVDVGPMGAALLSAIFVMTGGLTVMRARLNLNGAEYSSLFQGAVRWNGFVGIAAASSLFGSAGVTLMAIAIAFMVPTVNLLSIYVLTRHASAQPAHMRAALIAVIRNPLIVACLIGILLNVSGLGLAPVIDTSFDVLGSAALPLGLLAVGAALDLSHMRQFGGPILLGTGLKMLGMPVLVALTTWGFGVEGITRDIAILCASVPGATSSYILARQLGGDARMMAGMITATTVVALVTMPLILALFT